MLLHQQAPIDRILARGNVGGVVGKKEQSYGRRFIGRTRSPERDLPNDEILEFPLRLFGEKMAQVRIDRTWDDDVDADATWREGPCPRSGHGDQRAFCGRIEAGRRRALISGRRGCQDNGRARFQIGRKSSKLQHRAANICSHHAIEGTDINLFRRA